MTQDLLGKLFGDRGDVSQALFEQLYERGLHLITKSKKNMKNRLVKLIDQLLLWKRALQGFVPPKAYESINDQLKNMCQIEHSRLSASHTLREWSVFNFLVNVLAGLIAYTYQEKKPSLDSECEGLPALPPAVF